MALVEEHPFFKKKLLLFFQRIYCYFFKNNSSIFFFGKICHFMEKKQKRFCRSLSRRFCSPEKWHNLAIPVNSKKKNIQMEQFEVSSGTKFNCYSKHNKQLRNVKKIYFSNKIAKQICLPFSWTATEKKSNLIQACDSNYRNPKCKTNIFKFSQEYFSKIFFSSVISFYPDYGWSFYKRTLG